MTIIADIFEVSTLDQHEKLPWDESYLSQRLIGLIMFEKGAGQAE